MFAVPANLLASTLASLMFIAHKATQQTAGCFKYVNQITTPPYLKPSKMFPSH